ncbi:hypothetical protein Cri9333_4980 (plasmid) [Crinalium epipsammum PCC 9333]|uniref:Uncharacterized protein n=1 Tax=Crinalium epipsammum PCC 9333 TaxID=1173022 RepID=K9W8C9_9CYAN|nr:hypothetical protein [Crinalium epipsammum]AFZ15735.1 hypothetical protein Cri9333_4980 [Crinalium epipsammum PCC 9333]
MDCIRQYRVATSNIYSELGDLKGCNIADHAPFHNNEYFEQGYKSYPNTAIAVFTQN